MVGLIRLIKNLCHSERSEESQKGVSTALNMTKI